MTPEMVAAAVARGNERFEESRDAELCWGTKSGHGQGVFDVSGALAEDIIADVWGLPANKHGTLKTGRDVGPFEVQGTTRAHGSAKRTSMIIRPSDFERGVPIDTPYLLVALLGTDDDDTMLLGVNEYAILGWLRGDETMGLPENPGDAVPAYFEPHQRLHPCDPAFFSWLDTWKEWYASQT